MSGGSSQNTATSEQQQSSTQPWSAAQPMLYSILSQLGQSPTGATPQQLQTIQNIENTAGGLPNYGPAGSSVVDQALNLNTDPQQAALSTGIGALQPMLNANWLNPNSNPFLGPAMSTMNQDITNQIEGQAAAAGRPVGSNAAETQALARGLSQGEGGLLAGQFNTDVGQAESAAGMLPGMTGALTGQEIAPIAEGQSGLQTAASLPGLYLGPEESALSAAGLGASAPTINLQNLEGLSLPIAGLGAESQGTMTGTSTTTANTNPLSNILGLTMGGLGLLGSSGAFGSTGWLGSLAPTLMTSDERVKEDIEEVGELKDETPVYSFRFKGDPSRRTHIGLIAQDIEEFQPDAVVEIGGIKHVDYRRATERARRVGLLEMAA